CRGTFGNSPARLVAQIEYLNQFVMIYLGKREAMRNIYHQWLLTAATALMFPYQLAQWLPRYFPLGRSHHKAIKGASPASPPWRRSRLARRLPRRRLGTSAP